MTLRWAVWVPAQGSSASPREGPEGLSELPLLFPQSGDKEAGRG